MMTSSMTSHATIGNSTFAEPGPTEATMSSIDGPSDFTENMFDYMKGNKEPGTKKVSAVRSKVRPKGKLRLKPEVSGIIIESPSEFSDDTNAYMARDKAMSSPAKSEKSDLDGPSDFTANLVDYMRGNKAYSPPARASVQPVLGSKAVERSPTRRKESVGKVVLPSAGTSPQQYIGTTAGNRNSSGQERVALNVSEAASTLAKTPPQQRASGNANKSSSATLGKVAHGGNNRQGLAAENLSEPVGKKSATSPTTLRSDALSGTKSSSQPRIPSPMQANDNNTGHLPRVNKNLVINGTSDFTASLAAFINGTKVASAPIETKMRPNLCARPFSSPAKGENFDINSTPDFTANLAGHINDTNKQPAPTNGSHSKKTGTKRTVAAERAPAFDRQATKTKPSLKQDEIEVEGPSDFTENLVDYMKGTKNNSPYSKTSSSATVAAAVSPIDSTHKECSKAEEENDLHVQIAQLQAQLLQKDDEITVLQSSLAAAEKKSAEQEAEAEQKDATIDKLQASLKQSHQQCQGLEFELHQMTMEVDDLQENLNDVIINTVQHKDRVINRLHHNHGMLSGHVADLRAEIADKDLMLVENVEEVRKPQSEMDCELLKDALSKYADDLNGQHAICDNLALENKKLEDTVASLKRRQAEVEEKQEQREEEWQARAGLLVEEIDRRGAACLQLWGELEHPGERDAQGRQKYTYKYTEKSMRTASVF